MQDGTKEEEGEKNATQTQTQTQTQTPMYTSTWIGFVCPFCSGPSKLPIVPLPLRRVAPTLFRVATSKGSGTRRSGRGEAEREWSENGEQEQEQGQEHVLKIRPWQRCTQTTRENSKAEKSAPRRPIRSCRRNERIYPADRRHPRDGTSSWSSRHLSNVVALFVPNRLYFCHWPNSNSMAVRQSMMPFRKAKKKPNKQTNNTHFERATITYIRLGYFELGCFRFRPPWVAS